MNLSQYLFLYRVLFNLSCSFGWGLLPAAAKLDLWNLLMFSSSSHIPQLLANGANSIAPLPSED